MDENKTVHNLVQSEINTSLLKEGAVGGRRVVRDMTKITIGRYVV